MNPRPFDGASRRLYERACAVLGGAAPDGLCRWLGPEVWGTAGGAPADGESSATCADRRWLSGYTEVVLRTLGRRELAELFGCLPRAHRRQLTKSLALPVPGGAGMSRAEIAPLRELLQGVPFDPFLRAGLFRLSRALADREEQVVRAAVRAWPESWRRDLLFGWSSLARIPQCRAGAAGLRLELGRGEAA